MTTRDTEAAKETAAILHRRKRSLIATAEALDPSGLPEATHERVDAALKECAAILADAARECVNPIEERWAAETAPGRRT